MDHRFRHSPYEWPLDIGPISVHLSRVILRGSSSYSASVSSEGCDGRLLNISCNGDVVVAKVPIMSEQCCRACGSDAEGLLKLIPSDYKKLPHSWVCNYLFGGESDKDTSKLDIWSSRIEGKITPDFFRIHNKQVVFIEVKTTSSEGLEQYDRALDQYGSILDCSNMPSHNLVIVVTPTRVIHSSCITIGEGPVRDLVLLNRLARQAQEWLVSHSLLPPLPLLKNTENLTIPRGLVSEKDADPLIITKAMMRYWDSERTYTSFPSTLISEAKRAPEIETLRSKDSELLREFASKMPSALAVSPIRFGIFQPVVGDHLAVDTEMITNSILRELVEKYEQSPGEKHLYLNRTMSEYLQSNLQDHLKGLWGLFTSPPHSGLFGEQVREWDLDNFKSDLSRTTSPGSRLYIPREVKSEINKQVQARRIEKSLRSYKPTALDIHDLANELCKQCDVVVTEPVSTDLSNETQIVPFQHERWFQSTRFWQRLNEEINIGRFSSRGGWNRFHVQKIEPYAAWLFVKGTGLNSHQFYYLILKVSDGSTLTKPMKRIGNSDWYYTETIESLKVDKISQNLNSLERLVSLRQFWSQSFHNCERRSRTHFAASYLISNDAKQSTIDMLSLYRYVYMELCKEKRNRNPCKIWTKLPNQLRTRTQSWIAHRMIDLCLSDLEQPWVDSETTPDQMSFKCLKSWVDGEEIPSFQLILSLSYMHYAVPHPVASGLHGKVRICEKLLQEEMKLPLDPIKIGWSSPPIEEISDHEFSVSFIKALSQESSKRVLKAFPSWPEFWGKVCSRLDELKLSDFATMKRSTAVDYPDPGKRNYCFEEVIKLSERLMLNPSDEPRYSPFRDIPKLTQYQVTEPKNKNVSIFVKDQQTGTREIFVLPINLRILIKLMEVVSRIINETLPNETLSQPSRKTNLVLDHARLAGSSRTNLMKSIDRQRYKVVSLRFSSSSDAKTWCQQFCMPVFGCYLHTLLTAAYGEESRPLSELLMFILNQITQKHIHVDHRVKQWFKEHPDVQSSNPVFLKLKEMFSGSGAGLYPDGGIINRSNMMQGIPHETSSSVHAAYLLIVTSAIGTMVNSLSRENLPGLIMGKQVMTNMVSSDDSGILFTLPVGLELSKGGSTSGITPAAQKSLASLRSVMSRLGLAIEESKRLFCARVSVEKSTIFAESPVYEFNSQFYVGVSLNTAEIKFCCSPLTLGYNPSIRARVSEAISSLKGCLSEGLSQEQLAVVQLMLRRMHHRMLYVDWWKGDLSCELDKACSTSLGTLPLVPKGLIGFFNLQGIIDLSYITGFKSRACLHATSGILDTEFDDDFSLSLKIATKYGALKQSLGLSKAQLLSEILQREDGIFDYFNDLLPESMTIKLKLLNPGVKISMSYVDMAKIHMSSCYAATTQCIRTIKSKDKLSLRECLVKLTNQGYEQMPPPVNKVILRLWTLLQGALKVPRYREEARFRVHYDLGDEKDDVRKNAMKEVLSGWQYGFSTKRCAVLDWARTHYPVLHTSFEKTMEELGGDLFQLNAILRDLDSKPQVVNTIVFKPSAKTLSEFYLSFLACSMSKSYSMRPRSEDLAMQDPLPTSSSESLEKVHRILSYTAMLQFGWQLGKFKERFKFLIDNEYNERQYDVTDVLYPVDLVASVCRSNQVMETFDIRRLRLRGNKRLLISTRKCFFKISTFWYLLSKQESGEWTVSREPTSPAMPHCSLRQSICSESSFLVSNLELKLDLSEIGYLCIRPLDWNSESHLTFPPEFAPKRWEVYLAKLPVGTFSSEEYIRQMPDSYKTPFCKRLTKVVLEGNERLMDFSFWSKLSEQTQNASSQCDRNLCIELMNRATSDDPADLASLFKDEQADAPVVTADEAGELFDMLMDNDLDESSSGEDTGTETDYSVAEDLGALIDRDLGGLIGFNLDTLTEDLLMELTPGSGTSQNTLVWLRIRSFFRNALAKKVKMTAIFDDEEPEEELDIESIRGKRIDPGGAGKCLPKVVE
ncbi:MAG: RNA-dependent RNA polymerase [Hangzhou leishbuvirus 1]|nr:MAG: RNA-dependent RNA polymerase [Hangzhou leishbuvirus 1]